MSYDVIIIGGGHAGCEAAAVAARLGARAALVTMRADRIGAMSCNPAIGGLGKGHLVREVDAWDGLIARAADAAAIHHRMLNRSKGAAVQGPRIQADRRRFAAAVQAMIAGQRGLDVIEGAADRLLIAQGSVAGVELADGRRLESRAVVLATGTFLGGRLFCGMGSVPGGRVDEAPATALAVQLRALDLPMARLKTGTPPRLDGRTIDWAVLERQDSDDAPWTFSPLTPRRQLPQIACAVTRTNATTHDIIRASLDRSPLFAGEIEGAGPRYCPSIEDKVVRFGDRDGHQIFLEPEGLDDATVYPNGISTSLPADVQAAIIASIAGLERAVIVQPGYAVEYDHVDPRALDAGLGLRALPGLYCAGQINGTTGYEEAAAQGLVAGLNAACHALGRAPIRFDRAQSYIGVMIDDLTLQGVTEPYRMLTARAEYRLRLRADNAATRLTEQAIAAGAVGDERRLHHGDHMARRADAMALCGAPVDAAVLRMAGLAVADDDRATRPLFEWFRFVPFDVAHAIAVAPGLAKAGSDVIAEIIEDGRYAPYVERQEREVIAMRGDEAVRLPDDIDYGAIGGLSNEMVERLSSARPETLGAAGRIRGITPAALAAILVAARRRAA
jgi:tRNA uridine 5-carboxymethylaminomethyl modification enzyme